MRPADKGPHAKLQHPKGAGVALWPYLYLLWVLQAQEEGVRGVYLYKEKQLVNSW